MFTTWIFTVLQNLLDNKREERNISTGLFFILVLAFLWVSEPFVTRRMRAEQGQGGEVFPNK